MIGRDDRLFDPTQQPRAHARRQAGVPDLADQHRRFLEGERYDDGPVQEGIAIGWEAPNQASDQTVTATSFVSIAGAPFELSCPGAGEATWLVQVAWRLVIASTGAVDTDVYARALVDWGDGTLREPSNDLTGLHGAVSAFGPVDYAESAATGVAFSLRPGAVLKVRGGSTIRIGVGVRVGSGQSAVVQANAGTLNPHCYGTATPFRRVR